MKTVFAGGCGSIYAITTDGKLLRYRDTDPCSTADIGGPQATIRSGG